MMQIQCGVGHLAGMLEYDSHHSWITLMLSIGQSKVILAESYIKKHYCYSCDGH